MDLYTTQVRDPTFLESCIKNDTNILNCTENNCMEWETSYLLKI